MWNSLTSNSGGKGWFQRIDDLRSEPAAVEQLRALLPALEAADQPASLNQVMVAISEIATIFPLSDQSSGEWKIKAKFYANALAGLPISAIEAGIADYVNRPDSQYWPKPGPLKAICEQHALPTRAALRLAKAVLREDEA